MILVVGATGLLGREITRGLRHPDRRPAWPQGVVGSIPHCGHLAVAAAAPVSAFLAVGVDVEDLGDVDDELGEVVLTPAEQTALAVADEPGLLGIVFSLKESAYKCWSPLLGAALDWTDIEVVDRDALAFTADVVAPSAKAAPTHGDRTVCRARRTGAVRRLGGPGLSHPRAAGDALAWATALSRAGCASRAGCTSRAGLPPYRPWTGTSEPFMRKESASTTAPSRINTP